MAGMANGSRKLLLKINAYIARELDLGRTAIDNCNAYIGWWLHSGSMTGEKTESKRNNKQEKQQVKEETSKKQVKNKKEK